METDRAQKLRYPKPEDKRTPRSLTKPPLHANKLRGGLGDGKPLIETSPNSRKVQLFKQLALDTETTGTDFWHGCRPFFVSTCDEDGNLVFWEWEVNPLTRNVGHYWGGKLRSGTPGTSDVIRKAGLDPDLLEDSPAGARSFAAYLPPQDKRELTKLIESHHFILHNTKFDVRALESSGLPRINLNTCQDTLIASHALVSNESHKLKDLSLQYLDIDDDDQQALKDATMDARSIGRSLDWAIAKDGGHPHFPAQRNAPREGWWVFDTWLPRAVCMFRWFEEADEDYAPRDSRGDKIFNKKDLHKLDPKKSHPWWTVLRTYALRDVERTFGLWWLQLEALEHEGLMKVYEERRLLLEPLYEMEHNGVTVSKSRHKALQKKLVKEANEMHDRCLEIAEYKLDNLNSSRQLEGVLFGNFGIRPGKMTKSAIEGKVGGQTYAVDATVLTKLLDRTDGEHREFVWKILGYRAREKSGDYLEEYDLRGMPAETGWITLHTSINITGPDTVRFSSSGPNIQNVGKGGKRKDDPIPSLRSIFGPRPGREWFAIDYSNIEMRIFAYKCGDPQLIKAFESGYSVHLIFAEILYEEQWAECKVEAAAAMFRTMPRKLSPELEDKLRRSTGKIFKQKFEATYYQWVKNGNFALIYGAGEDRADTTYHRPGAYRLIRKMLPKIDQFMKEKDHEAKAYGYITLDSGYRLYIPPTEPHVAVNYYVQGDAGWCMVLAINRVHRYLKSLNDRIRREGPSSGDPTYQMIMTIHDELDFDFPKHPRNEQVIKEIGKIMASSGEAIGVPTPVEIERHAKNWAEGEVLAI